MIRIARVLPILALFVVLARVLPGGDSEPAIAESPADSLASPIQEAPYLVLPSEATATDEFQWVFRVRVVNRTDRGIYCDSLGIEITDDYAGSRRRGHTWSYFEPGVTQILKSVSPNDSAFFTYSGAASSEYAMLTLRLHAHTYDGRPLVTPGATVRMTPPPISRRYPPILLDTPKGRVEYAFVPEVWPSQPSPAVLLIHSEDGQSRDWLPLAWNMANNGFACMLMSLPGYGFTAGPPDFGGPRSLEVASLLLDRLRRSSNIDSNRVAVWGVSEGATVAALLAAKRKDVKAVVLQSGIYDLPATFANSQSQELRQILGAEAGAPKGWKARSPLLAKAVPAAAVLILHGDEDQVVPPEQAQAYGRLLQEKRGSVTLTLFPAAGHRLPIMAVRDSALRFLRDRMPPPTRPEALEKTRN